MELFDIDGICPKLLLGEIESTQDRCEECTCNKRHAFLDIITQFSPTLNTVSPKVARSLLKLYVKYRSLLEKYFCIFCEYFAARELRNDLINMISLCNQPENKMESFLVHIVDGLVKCGLKYSEALCQVIYRTNNLTLKSISVLLRLITDDRNTHVLHFHKEIQLYSKLYDKECVEFHSSILNRLLSACVKIVNESLFPGQLKKNFWLTVNNIMKQTSENTTREINKKTLSKFTKINPHKLTLS